MKKISYFLIATLSFLGGLTSCEKEIMSYNGLEGVYFAVQTGGAYWASEASMPYSPYTIVNFVQVPGNDTIVKLKIMSTGPLKDYDRTVSLEMNLDSTTANLGVDYDAIPLELTIPANSYYVYLPVKIHRSSELETVQKSVGFRLVPNNDFALSFKHFDAIPGLTFGTVVPEFDASMHSIKFNDFLVQPTVWPGSVNAAGMEAGLWGAFSKKKIELIESLMGFTYNDFMSTTTMPLIKQMLTYQTVGRYLIQQYNNHTPILEVDGRLMFIDGVPWKSYPGVPWIPDYN